VVEEVDDRRVDVLQIVGGSDLDRGALVVPGDGGGVAELVGAGGRSRCRPAPRGEHGGQPGPQVPRAEVVADDRLDMVVEVVGPHVGPAIPVVLVREQLVAARAPAFQLVTIETRVTCRRWPLLAG
jgi:hypothetical protein